MKKANTGIYAVLVVILLLVGGMFALQMGWFTFPGTPASPASVAPGQTAPASQGTTPSGYCSPEVTSNPRA